MIIEEDYVSFETAKLLKEKGFPQNELINSIPYYVQNGNLYDGDINTIRVRFCPYAVAPTHQMALKWLREVHHIHFDIHPRLILEQWSGYDIAAYSFNEDGFYKKQTVIKGLNDDTPYEQAVEAAIKFCLENLI